MATASESGVTPGDIDTGLGRPLTEDEEQRLTRWIRDAEVFISSKFTPDGDDNWPFDPDVYAMVVRWAVEERWTKSAGTAGGAGEVSSKTVQVDDGAVTTRYGEYQSKSGSRWWFLDDWWDVLTPQVESGAFSTTPGFEADLPTAVDRPWWGL